MRTDIILLLSSASTNRNGGRYKREAKKKTEENKKMDNNKKKRIVGIGILAAIGLLAFAILLAFAASGSGGVVNQNAEGNGMGTITASAVTTSSINYQGRLTDSSGSPLTGTYTMTFRLYNVSTGGTALATDTHDVNVTDGLFNTGVDFDQSYFDGRELWLGVAVGTDSEMTPRQELRPVPYALSLVPGANIIGSAPFALHAESTHASGRGIRGYATATSGTNYGVVGASKSPDGYGGYFYNNGGGIGMYGKGGKYGGFFTTDRGTGSGVRAYTTGDIIYGVYASTRGNGSAGVIGDTTGVNSRGVYALTTGEGSDGVYAKTTGDNSKGVYAETTGDNSDGVHASTTGYESKGVHVYTTGDGSEGVNAYTTGDGSEGVNAYTTGYDSDGVYAYTTGDRSKGVYAETTGDNSDGVFAWTTGDNSDGVFAHSNKSYGVYAVSAASAGVYAKGKGGGADIILGSSAANDNGNIHSDPTYDSSDIVLVTNDCIQIDLDNDGNGEDADFEIYDKDDKLIFDVDESGDVSYGGSNIAAFPRPAYDSGWVSISKDTTKTLTHNLGGNPDNYVVDMQFYSSSLGRHQLDYGGDYRTALSVHGAYWHGLDSTQIKVRRSKHDPVVEKIRIRIWVYK